MPRPASTAVAGSGCAGRWAPRSRTRDSVGPGKPARTRKTRQPADGSGSGQQQAAEHDRSGRDQPGAAREGHGCLLDPRLPRPRPTSATLTRLEGGGCRTTSNGAERRGAHPPRPGLRVLRHRRIARRGRSAPGRPVMARYGAAVAWWREVRPTAGRCGVEGIGAGSAGAENTPRRGDRFDLREARYSFDQYPNARRRAVSEITHRVHMEGFCDTLVLAVASDLCRGTCYAPRTFAWAWGFPPGVRQQSEP